MMALKSKSELEDMTSRHILDRHAWHKKGEALIELETMQKDDLRELIKSEEEMQTQQFEMIEKLKRTLGNTYLDVENAQKNLMLTEDQIDDLKKSLTESKMQTVEANQDLDNMHGE